MFDDDTPLWGHIATLFICLLFILLQFTVVCAVLYILYKGVMFLWNT